MPAPPHGSIVTRIVLLALMVGWTGAVQARQVDSRLGYAYNDLEMNDGTTVRYALVLPDGFDAAQTYPVFLALPPGPQKEGSVDWGLESFGGEAAARRGWIVVSPIAPAGRLYFRGSERYIPQLLDHIESQYRVEGGKFHVGGCSNGGRSAFRVALDYPERFHSVVTFPGYPPQMDDFDHLGRLQGMHVHMFVGEDENRVWIDGAQRAHETLNDLDISTHLTIVPGEGHVMESLKGDPVIVLLDEIRAAMREEASK